jgi:hypothetical protein
VSAVSSKLDRIAYFFAPLLLEGPLLDGQRCGRCAKPVSTTEDLVILYFSKDEDQPFESVAVNHWTCVYPPWQGEIPF